MVLYLYRSRILIALLDSLGGGDDDENNSADEDALLAVCPA